MILWSGRSLYAGWFPRAECPNNQLKAAKTWPEAVLRFSPAKE